MPMHEESFLKYFKRSPIEALATVIFVIPLTIIIYPFTFLFDILGANSTKKQYAQLVEALSAFEKEMTNNAQTRTEFLQTCLENIKHRIDPSVDSMDTMFDRFTGEMQQQAENNLSKAGCELGVLYKNDPIVNHAILEETIDRVFANSNEEIEQLVKKAPR